MLLCGSEKQNYSLLSFFNVSEYNGYRNAITTAFLSPL